METHSLATVLAEHPFCKDLRPDWLELLAGCAENRKWLPGERLFRDGEPARHTFLLRAGRVAFEVRDPVRGAVPIETAEEGELVGWAWLFPPYHYHFDAVALGVVRAISLDGDCMRRKCEADPAFGYEITKRILHQAHRRLERSRVAALDLYGGGR